MSTLGQAVRLFTGHINKSRPGACPPQSHCTDHTSPDTPTFPYAREMEVNLRWALKGKDDLSNRESGEEPARAKELRLAYQREKGEQRHRGQPQPGTLGVGIQLLLIPGLPLSLCP